MEEIKWPALDEISNKNLAEKIVEFSRELAKRWQESRNRSLEAALKIWPQLQEALALAGRKLSIPSQGPVMPKWANEPVVGTKGFYGNKPKNKKEALEIALTYGDSSGWATIGELWLWVGGGGPIVERTLTKYGFGQKK